jgi:hypothetical protein
MKTNLYIIEEVLRDYTDGVVVIAAPNLEICRELFIAEFDNDYDTVPHYDKAIESGAYKILSVNDQPDGVVSYVFGGG